MFDTHTFKQQLNADVETMLTAREQYQQIVATLEGLGDNRPNKSLSWLDDAFIKLLRKRFNESDAALTAQYVDGLPVKIETSSNFYVFSQYEGDDSGALPNSLRKQLLNMEERGTTAEAREALRNGVDVLPWGEIKAHLDKQCQEVHQNGMQQGVATVLNFLGLKRAWRTPQMKQTALVCERHCAFEGYNLYNEIQDLVKFSKALDPIVKAADLDIGPSLAEFGDALWLQRQRSNTLKSRDRFGKGSHIDITVFKAKVKYTLSAAVLEAIQAATMLYGTEADINAVLEFTQQQAA